MTESDGEQRAPETPAPGAWNARSTPLPHRGTRRRAITFAVLAGLGTLAGLLAIDGFLAARAMLRGVTLGRSQLSSGVEGVVTGDPTAAEGSFQRASLAATSAIDAAGHPSMRLAGLLPLVSDNLDGVVAVARAERDSAAAGLVLVNAARALGWEDILLPASTSLGNVDLTKVRAAAPLLDDVARRLRDASDTLAAQGGGNLVGPVATGYDDAVTSLTQRTALAGDAARLARLMPSFLGGDAPRRYLVAVQRLGEPTPTGGTVGEIGVLTAVNGSLTMSALEIAMDIPTAETAAPRGPEVAAGLLSAAAPALGPLNGVILTDSVGLQELLWMTGDAEVPGLRQPLRFEDALVALERTPFLDLRRAAGEERQAALGTAVLESALGRHPSTEAFAAAAAGMVADRHLVLFSTTKREQAMIRGLGAAGVDELGRNPIAWTATSAAANLAGTYARWVTTQVVTLQGDGSAKVKTILELQNQAPVGPPSTLLGRAFGSTRVGAWAADLRLALPDGAVRVSAETSTPSATEVGDYGEGVTFLAARLHADPGSAASLIVTYRRPGAAEVLDGQETYRLRVVPQPMAFPGILRVRIQVPDGTVVLDASEGFERGADVVRYEGRPTATLDLFVRYG